jgi:hypothetical protein
MNSQHIVKFAVVRISAKAAREKQQAENKALPFSEFAAAFSKPATGQKDGAYLVRGECNGNRCDANMNLATLVVVDGDSSFNPATGEVDDLSAPAPEIAKRALDKLGLSYVVHTSHSHQQGEKGNRWRAYVPLSRPVTKSEFPTINTAVHNAIQAAGCPVTQTTESATFAQPWYLPRIATKDAPFEHYTGTGKSFDVDAALAVAKIEAEAVQRVRTQPALPEGGSVIDAFNRVYPLDNILSKHGYKQINQHRWLSPDSTSGEAGVHIADDGNVLYSHGSSDALADGNGHDSFSVYRMLEHDGDLTQAVKTAAALLGLDYLPAKPAKVLTHADIQWQHPTALTVMEYPPAPDETHMPGIMWDIVREVSISRQASAAISLPTAIACVCAVLRGRLFVTRCDCTQTELVTLYTSSVAGSGEGKSSTRLVLEAPCEAIAMKLASEAKELQAVYASEAKAAAGRTKAIEKSLIDEPAATLTDTDKATLIENQKVIDNKPKSGLLICSEITPEGLVDKLQQHGFVSVFAGEGAAVVEAFSKYSGGDSQDTGVSPFLSAYDNERAQSARRKDASYGVDHARACLSLALQPYALQKLWCNGGLQGRGFINRLTIIIAKPSEVEFHRNKKPRNAEALQRAQTSWANALGRIDEYIRALGDEDGLIKLSEDADDAWADFAQQWQPRVREGGDLWHLTGFFKKRLPAQVLRIAAIYHAIDGGKISVRDNPATISIATMQKAINTGELIAQHFISISKGAGFNPVIMKATAVLARIREKGLTEITAKVIYDNGWAGITTAANAAEVLAMLVENNCMHRVDKQADGKGRPAAPVYLINPLAAKNKTLTAKPAKPAKIENMPVAGIKTVLAGLTGRETKKAETVEYDEVSI